MRRLADYSDLQAPTDFRHSKQSSQAFNISFFVSRNFTHAWNHVTLTRTLDWTLVRSPLPACSRGDVRFHMLEEASWTMWIAELLVKCLTVFRLSSVYAWFFLFVREIFTVSWMTNTYLLFDVSPQTMVSPRYLPKGAPWYSASFSSLCICTHTVRVGSYPTNNKTMLCLLFTLHIWLLVFFS